jgi:hypothetical protein
MNTLSRLGIGLGLGLMTFTGCAATGTMVPGGGEAASARRMPSLEESSSREAAVGPSLPERIAGDTELRAADRFAHRVKAELGGTAVASVALCVLPDGTVADATLAQSSGLAIYDDLVVDAARGWEYDSYAAPAGTKVCDTVSIVYKAR